MSRRVTGRLEGKVAIVTGAGSGIGRVACELFSGEGAAVVAADVDGGAAESTAETIAASGGRADAVEVDVTDEEQVEAMVETATLAFGGLHVMFNCAGIFPDDDGGIADTPLDTWDRVMRVNLKGVFLCCRAGLPALEASGGGSIVNVASFVALDGSSHGPGGLHRFQGRGPRLHEGACSRGCAARGPSELHLPRTHRDAPDREPAIRSGAP